MTVSIGKIKKAVKDNPDLPYGFVRDLLFALEENNNMRNDLSHEELFGDLEDSLFTAKEAMEYLEVSSATFRRYVHDGRICADTEVGTSHLFKLEDLRELKLALKKIKG